MKKQNNKKLNKKAFLFTMDAFFASLLLVGALVMLSQVHVQKSSTENMEFLSQDVLETLSTVKINEIKDSNDFVKKEFKAGNISNLNNTILVQIGEYWAINRPDKARALARSILDDLVPDSYGFNISIEGDVIYNKSGKNLSNAISTSRMISGIEKGKPIQGSTSDAFLKSIRNKPSSVYLYFGGFVGQGNITGQLFVPPVDNVTQIIMELQVGTTYRLYINGEQCNESGADTIFNPSPPTVQNMTADIWDITHCNKSINRSGGLNNFTFLFSSINGAYIGGGYIRVSYRTDEFQEIDYGVNVTRFYLPGIEGIVNLFDSFYVPGELRNLSMHLHYIANHSDSNYTFYVTIGNQTIYWDNDSEHVVDINFTDSNFSMLNYSAMNSSTIPIRIGFENVSFQQVVTGGEGFGDIVLITDLSGSMGDRFDSGSSGNDRGCNDPNLYDSDTSRISVARCVENIFVDQVLENNTLNRIGLVGYGTQVYGDVDQLTNNEIRIKNNISSYLPYTSPNYWTCVSCGEYGAIEMLLNPPPAQLHKDVWRFNQDWQFSAPDPGWDMLGYDDSLWNEGQTPFGFGGGELTTIGDYNTTVNLWEHFNDDEGVPNDFSSGILNQTGNSFGLGTLAQYDGWDTQDGGIYGGDGNVVTINGLVNVGGGDFEQRITINGPSTSSPYPHETGAGAYGIQFNVTDTMISVLNDGGYVVLSFDYAWDDRGYWENTDQVWIKARITNTTGSFFDLGSNLDGFGTGSPDSGADSTIEVFTKNDPDGDESDFFSQDITDYISDSGFYYLDIGAKSYRNYYDDDGEFEFDNIQMIFVNRTGDTYYRNTFTMTNLGRFSDARLSVASDDYAEVYLNGYLLSDDSPKHTASYWNVDRIPVAMANFTEGVNLLAVKLTNDDNQTGFFDLELTANMTNRQKAMVIMSDGQANHCHGPDDVVFPFVDTNGQSGNCADAWAEDETIEFARYAANVLNISVYTVFFGNASLIGGADNLNDTACVQNCSHFYTSENVSGLADVYQDIADSILTGFSSRQSQVIVVAAGGDYEESILLPDSYIEINYSPIVEKPATNEISLSFESPKFENCTPQVDIPTGIRVIDSKLISYSGHHWTDYVGVNDVEVFNLSHYNNVTYISLGDPFVVQIPPNLLVPGAINNITLKTGDEPTLNTNCSENNSLQYVGMINASTGRTNVLPGTEGCNWTVESEDLENVTIKIPKSYNGSKNCNYTNASIFYDSNSTYDMAVYQLLSGLDFDRDGRTIINLVEENLEIKVILVTGLPFQWGPSVIEAHVWQ